MMTRKDYVTTAEILNKVFTEHEMQKYAPVLVEKMVNRFTEMFASDNPNFDADRFAQAVTK